MNVFVTGWNGLVGQEIRRALPTPSHEVRGGDIDDCLVVDEDLIEACIGSFAPDWIVNLAALTNVDACEGEQRLAYLANTFGAENCARVAKRRKARLMQVSTDYVFDGQSSTPYDERSAPRAVSVYGLTKLFGEEGAACIMGKDLLVVRGQSLYGKGRKSFPDSIRARAATASELPVVTDQVVSPTWARDFAEGLVLLMEKGTSGTVHLSASGQCTWNEFAKAILEEAGITTCRITETTADALARPAKRPAWSVFDLSKYRQIAGVPPRPWREQLHEYAVVSGWAK